MATSTLRLAATLAPPLRTSSTWRKPQLETSGIQPIVRNIHIQQSGISGYIFSIPNSISHLKSRNAPLSKLFLNVDPGLLSSRIVSRSAVGNSVAETSKKGIETLAGGGSNKGGSDDGGGGDGGGGGEEALGWISSALVFAFYGALIYYAAAVAPNQTPYRDQYFIEKLVGLRSGDGYILNPVLVCEFLIMGLWPMIYSSLLLPSGRSQKNTILAWPFLVTSFGVGAFALVPYFGLWRPPPPTVSKEELKKFPLNLLENKLVSYGTFVSAVGLVVAAALSGDEAWTEFLQYIRESKFINVMSVDFLTLSSLAPFWVYNDMSVRRWLDKGFWLLPVSLVPLIGPALYVALRPALPLSMIEDEE